MSERIIHEAVTPVTSETGVIRLCEAGRYREAAAALEGLDPDRFPLAFGLVETARGNQETAKDYLSRAVRQGAGDTAQVQLACAYWRTGETKEAQAILATLPDSFKVLLLKAIIVCELNVHEGLELLDRAAKYRVPAGLQARLHNQRAMLLSNIGERDRAIQEYDAAIHYFKIAKSDCVPLVINNLAREYAELGQYERAHTEINKAIRLLRGEPEHLARAYDEKSRIYLAENRIEDAERCSRLALKAIESTDRCAWRAEALLTRATVLNRKGEMVKALAAADQAEEIGRYLNNDQIVLDACTKKREVAEALISSAEIRRIESALRLTESVRGAAKKLQMSHVALLKAIDRKKLKLPTK